MFSQITDAVLGVFSSMWYVGIFVMMTIESSFVPFPSEVAMIPAWALAQRWEMSLLIALLVGTAGAWLGATINYILGRYLGWPVVKSLIHKYGKYIFLNESHYLQAEKFFQEKWAITTFFGRFVPAVRQLISIPAGVFRMNFAVFSLWTILGAGLWNIILLSIGYFFAGNQEVILSYMKEIIIGILCLVIVYFGYKWWKKRKV